MRVVKYLLLLFLSFSFYHLSYSQEKDSIVILSDKTGKIITKDKRDYYKLFLGIEVFNYAVVYKSSKNKYFALINYSQKGRQKDTLIYFPETSMLMIAEKIQNYEELSEGNYRIGSKPVVIKIFSTDSISSEGIATYHQIQRMDSMAALKNYLFSSFDDGDMLVFDSNRTQVLDDYPYFGFGLGLSSHSPDLQGLNPYFTSIENKYRDQGYSIGHPSTDFNKGLLVWCGIKICLSKNINIEIEGGKSDGDEFRFYNLSGSFIYYPNLFEDIQFRPYFESGLSLNHFRAEKNYYSRISPISPNGSYSTLEQIVGEGSKVGFHIETGFEYYLGKSPSLNLFIKYLYVPELTTTSTVGNFVANANVRLGSFMLGAKIYIYF